MWNTLTPKQLPTRHKRGQEGWTSAQHLSAEADRASQNSSQNISSSFIGWQGSVGYGKAQGANMIS